MAGTVAEQLRDERIHTLEISVRYYAALSRRLERRAEAAELELESLRERMAIVGHRQYSSLDD
jgi:hypothetical protein